MMVEKMRAIFLKNCHIKVVYIKQKLWSDIHQDLIIKNIKVS